MKHNDVVTTTDPHAVRAKRYGAVYVALVAASAAVSVPWWGVVDTMLRILPDITGLVLYPLPVFLALAVCAGIEQGAANAARKT